MTDRDQEFRGLVSDIRGELREHRDAVMGKLGGLESAYRNLATEVVETKAIARRAEMVAAAAKRDAEAAGARMESTEDALKTYVDKVSDATKADRALVIAKTDDVLEEIRASRALGAARSQLRLEAEAERAVEIETMERRKRHLKWAVGVAVSVAQVVQLYLLVWRHLS